MAESMAVFNRIYGIFCLERRITVHLLLMTQMIFAVSIILKLSLQVFDRKRSSSIFYHIQSCSLTREGRNYS